MSTPTQEKTPQRYHYDPSLAAAIIFAVIFGLSSLAHTYQIVKARTWCFIAFLIGVLCMSFPILVIPHSVFASNNPQ